MRDNFPTNSDDPVGELFKQIPEPEVTDAEVERLAGFIRETLRTQPAATEHDRRIPSRSSFLARFSRWQIAALIALLIGFTSGSFAAVYLAVKALFGEPKPTTATFAELEREPAGAEHSSNGDSAYLVGRNKQPLIVWQTVPGGVEDTAFVSELDSGNGPLAIVGYSIEPRNPYPGAFLAYSAKLGEDRRLPELLWTLPMKRDYLPDDVRDMFSGVDLSLQLSARRCRVLDVFPEIEGPELVFVYQHLSTLCSVLIADLDGKVRYCVTHDGNLLDAGWIEQPGLLVFAGLNGDAQRGERGLTPESYAHPKVVFAIRPVLDDVQAKWVQTDTHVGVMPEFYRYVDNSAVIQRESYATLGTIERSLDPLRHIGVVVHAKTPSGDAAVTLSIDAAGNEVPGKRQKSLIWSWEEKSGFLPSDELIQLKELPPIQKQGSSENLEDSSLSPQPFLRAPYASLAHPQCRG